MANMLEFFVDYPNSEIMFQSTRTNKRFKLKFDSSTLKYSVYTNDYNELIFASPSSRTMKQFLDILL